ncbi:MAG: 4-hydroxythreonine-4-phosphate dehydrogenase PdxA [Bacteroidetes bacterium]|nr:4-hydroxythreonine-4-phosphate dehydrogenase PdxA [Bacteroidota bacterium]MBK9799098.1 4-hydroxythreonine-4-phosphate dehydrogenase PdxA [Bacteroidota bacterium]MBP6414802.1 4-hydroxythreonine-4-phosphate dehydrogenase PdxA [Bacteroidia bacterium]
MIESDNHVKVGISMGDFNGIGMEVIIKTFMDNRMMQLCTPIVYGASRIASFHRKALGIADFSFNIIREADAANPKMANLINCWDEEIKMELGTSTNLAGEKAIASLELAIADLKSGKIDVLVTAPINKNNVQSANFKFPGHTEYLAEKFDVKDYLMLLVSDDLRIGTVTGHIPLNQVASALSTEKIYTKIKLLNNSLIQDFGIRKPKIAVLGLNPHAGDNGLLGEEETKLIIPAIEKLKSEGIMAIGPYAADGFFGSQVYHQFDGVMAMYHDQGLIPFKAMAFESGVNFTAGLPIIRTSPDHGTGYDIAGKNKASESSFRQAVYLACDLFHQRKQQAGLVANPLKITNQRRERG